MWPPPKPKPKRIIAIASSNFSNLKEPARTLHIALLARAATIFRVEQIIIYKESNKPCTPIKTVLEALEAPQYLRKYLVPKSRHLRYIGAAPPLRSPSHLLRDEQSPYREGYILRRIGDKAIVDIGLEKPVQAKVPPGLGPRVTLTQIQGHWQYIDREQIPVYWGYTVTCQQSLKQTLQNHTNPKTLVIATSRKGTPINTLATQLKTKIATAETLLVLFGTHNKGIQEIATQENINPQHYIHYTLNTAPLQGTKTIRTEEAVLTTMAILNLLDQQTTT